MSADTPHPVRQAHDAPATTWWHRESHDTAPSADALKTDPRWRTGGGLCTSRQPSGHGTCYPCTRHTDHPGRHIAVGDDDRAYAAWPGAHEPTLDDLGDPAPTGTDLADCERRTPPALALPDGWEPLTSTDGTVTYVRHEVPASCRYPNLYAEVSGVEISACAGMISPGVARALAARLVEAAGIIEQLRAGAR